MFREWFGNPIAGPQPRARANRINGCPCAIDCCGQPMPPGRRQPLIKSLMPGKRAAARPVCDRHQANPRIDPLLWHVFGLRIQESNRTVAALRRHHRNVAGLWREKNEAVLFDCGWRNGPGSAVKCAAIAITLWRANYAGSGQNRCCSCRAVGAFAQFHDGFRRGGAKR